MSIYSEWDDLASGIKPSPLPPFGPPSIKMGPNSILADTGAAMGIPPQNGQQQVGPQQQPYAGMWGLPQAPPSSQFRGDPRAAAMQNWMLRSLLGHGDSLQEGLGQMGGILAGNRDAGLQAKMFNAKQAQEMMLAQMQDKLARDRMGQDFLWNKMSTGVGTGGIESLSPHDRAVFNRRAIAMKNAAASNDPNAVAQISMNPIWKNPLDVQAAMANANAKNQRYQFDKTLEAQKDYLKSVQQMFSSIFGGGQPAGGGSNMPGIPLPQNPASPFSPVSGPNQTAQANALGDVYGQQMQAFSGANAVPTPGLGGFNVHDASGNLVGGARAGSPAGIPSAGPFGTMKNAIPNPSIPNIWGDAQRSALAQSASALGGKTMAGMGGLLPNAGSWIAGRLGGMQDAINRMGTQTQEGLAQKARGLGVQNTNEVAQAMQGINAQAQAHALDRIRQATRMMSSLYS